MRKKPIYQQGGQLKKQPSATGRSYYDPNLQVMFLTEQDWNNPDVQNHEGFHHIQNLNGGLSVPQYQQGPVKRPSAVHTDDIQGGYYNRRSVDEGIIGNNFIQRNPSFQFVPSQIIYDKFIDQEMYNQPWTEEGEAVQYEKSLSKKQNGGISTTGYKEDSPHKNRDFNIIPSNQITMAGVKKKIMGVDNKGNKQLMLPGHSYVFPGQYVTEYPIMQYGGPITPQERSNWNAMNTAAFQQGYLGDDHSKQPGQQFMQQYGIDPGRLQAYQQDFQNFSQSDPSRIYHGPELSKVDDIYGHRTSRQRYRTHQYRRTKGDKEISNFNTGTEPISMNEWDSRSKPMQGEPLLNPTDANKFMGTGYQPQQATAMNTKIPAANTGFLSKEEAIAAKKARGGNPDSWYAQMGGSAMQGPTYDPNNPWQNINPNDPNMMNQVNQPVQNAMANTVPINNFGNNQTVTPNSMGPGQPQQQQPYNWQQWGQVAAAGVQLQDTVNNTAEAFVDFFGNRKANRELQKRNQWQGSSENMYKQSMYNNAGNKGDYVTTGTSYGAYRPQNQTFKGMYQQGGQLPQGEFGLSVPFTALPEPTGFVMPTGAQMPVQGASGPVAPINDDFTADIVRHESNGNYKAVNPNSSAAGKYQFLWKTWKPKIQAVTGIGSKQDFLNSPQAQEQFYNWYQQNEMLPAVQRLKVFNSKGLTDGQLAKLYHFKGEKGAIDYLKTGSDKTRKNNTSINNYISYKEGGTYELDEMTIAAIENAGGKIKFID